MFPVFLHLEFPSEFTVVGSVYVKRCLQWLMVGFIYCLLEHQGPFGFHWYVHFFSHYIAHLIDYTVECKHNFYIHHETKKSFDYLHVKVGFIVLAWNLSHNILEVCLYLYHLNPL